MTAPATSQRAATVEFDHVTKSYDARATRAGAPGAVNDLSLDGPGGEDLRARRAVGLRQDDDPQDGQPPDRAHRRSHPPRRHRRGDARRHGAPPQHRLRDPADRACSRTRRSRTNVVTVPRLLGWSKARMAARAEELLALVGLEPATYRRALPGPALGRRAAARRRGPGAGRRSADHADGRAVRRGRPHRPRAPPGRVPPPAASGSRKTIVFVTHDIDEAVQDGRPSSRCSRSAASSRSTTRRPRCSPSRRRDFVARFVGTDRGLKRAQPVPGRRSCRCRRS